MSEQFFKRPHSFLIACASLYLDIWTPANATQESKLPVKVFVLADPTPRGGISDILYDGCYTADAGVTLYVYCAYDQP